mgnify:FL=1
MKKKDKGITLIALVISLIVLLILASVTIAALSGNNGILTKAKEAKEKTEIGEEKEVVELATISAQMGEEYQSLNQVNLQKEIDKQYGEGKTIVRDNGDNTFTVSFIKSKREYDITSKGVEKGKDWNEIMQNAKAPEEQKEERNAGVIGIGTDGKTVNMDLWEYTLNNGTYTLNDIDDIKAEDANTENKGYLGKIINGKIEGTVPMYIKGKNDKNFIPVTNLKDTFSNLQNDFDELVTTPVIPSTVTEMQSTFSRCGKLKNITNLPPKLEIFKWTFYECTSFENFNIFIPNTVTNMFGTFYYCRNLKKFDSELPKNLKNLEGTFWGCDSLKKFKQIIPNSVETMQHTFKECINLESFDADIPENVTNMMGTFQKCKNLKRYNSEIPNSVINMDHTFEGCTNLSEFNSAIPENVINMFATFSQCENLTEVNMVIPESVTNLQYTFGECLNLRGTIEINANVTGKLISNNLDYMACFGYSTSTHNKAKLTLKGTCTVLEKILEDAKSYDATSNIEIEK